LQIPTNLQMELIRQRVCIASCFHGRVASAPGVFFFRFIADLRGAREAVEPRIVQGVWPLLRPRRDAGDRAAFIRG